MADDGWQSWDGLAKRPVGKDVAVHYQIRCIDRGMAERGKPVAAGKLRWTHEASPGDIVAWKRA
jgi:hypothetical protein